MSLVDRLFAVTAGAFDAMQDDPIAPIIPGVTGGCSSPSSTMGIIPGNVAYDLGWI